MTVRSRWAEQQKLNRHFDAGIAANNDNWLRLAKSVEAGFDKVKRKTDALVFVCIVLTVCVIWMAVFG